MTNNGLLFSGPCKLHVAGFYMQLARPLTSSLSQESSLPAWHALAPRSSEIEPATAADMYRGSQAVLIRAGGGGQPRRRAEHPISAMAKYTCAVVSTVVGFILAVYACLVLPLWTLDC